MTNEDYADFQYYVGVIAGVAMALNSGLRADLLGVAVGLSNLTERVRREGDDN